MLLDLIEDILAVSSSLKKSVELLRVLKLGFMVKVRIGF